MVFRIIGFFSCTKHILNPNISTFQNIYPLLKLAYYYIIYRLFLKKLLVSYKKLSILLFSYFLISVSSESLFAQIPDTLKPKNVLILFALEHDLAEPEVLVENLKTTIRTEYKYPVNYYMDFLELSRFNDEKHINIFFEYLGEKYKGTKFELFISVGPGLFQLTEKFGIPFLESVPRLLVELTLPNENYIFQGKNTTAVFLWLYV